MVFRFAINTYFLIQLAGPSPTVKINDAFNSTPAHDLCCIETNHTLLTF
jgi:hypothetical protein